MRRREDWLRKNPTQRQLLPHNYLSQNPNLICCLTSVTALPYRKVLKDFDCPRPMRVKNRDRNHQTISLLTDANEKFRIFALLAFPVGLSHDVQFNPSQLASVLLRLEPLEAALQFSSREQEMFGVLERGSHHEYLPAGIVAGALVLLPGQVEFSLGSAEALDLESEGGPGCV
jgi:hypothetical protein